jgi:Flp pilus assembly protein TadG
MFRLLAIRFVNDRKANVAIIFAIMIVPTVYLLGMAMDYTQAQRRQSQLDAAADAAAIAAVTPSMMAVSTTVAQTTATNVFNATANGIATALTGSPDLTVTISNVGLVRTATVSYTAKSTNAFPSLLGSTAWPIRGSATASASGAPNINFYLLLDDSPSMAIGATPADIQTLVNATPSQGGCGFACHQSNPGKDGLGNPNGWDNYNYARYLGVTLRIDLVAQAVSSLMSTAQSMEQQNNNTYKAAIYTFDYGVNTIYAPSGLPSSDLSSAGTAAANNIQLLQVYSNNWLTSSNNNSDTDTNIESALSRINTIMPAPGGGTNQTGDTPQEVVFLVTDGVDDMFVSSKSACSGTPVTSGTQYRCQQPINPSTCTTIKNRGIRIAVLYTEYLQLPTNNWYNTYISQFNNPSPDKGQIAQNLQSCASTNLFYDVQSGGDITAALNELFQRVVNTAAHLTQ